MTNKMSLAHMISQYESLPIFDVHSAGGRYCVSGDRRLRQLGAAYKACRHAMSAYEYRDMYYYFTKGFQRFCGVWYRRELKKNEREAA